MAGRVIYSPTRQHVCFFMYPVEAGLLAVAGTRWRCDSCGAVWELVRGTGWCVVVPAVPEGGAMTDDGWRQVHPKPEPAPAEVEVELVGGPRDGELRKVTSLETPLVFLAVLIPPAEEGASGTWDYVPSPAGVAAVDARDPAAFVYRVRHGFELGNGQPIPFDYMPPVPA